VTKAERSWILNDWANSAYSVAITTAILPIYFKDVASRGLDPALSTAYWGYGNTAATVVSALAAPVLGTLADTRGYKKPSFALFTWMGVAFTAALALAGPGAWLPCVALYALSAIGFSCMNVFYDAFIADVTTRERMDWISSSGFAWGYIGSTIPFLLCIVLIMKPSLAGLSSQGAAMRVSFVITAAWWLVFSLPMLKDVRQASGVEPSPHPVADSFRRLGQTFRELGRHREAFLFLVAYFFYSDGISSLIKMSAVLGRDIGIPAKSLLGMIIMLQVAAFPFALLYGKLAARFSPVSLILAGIAVFLGVTLAVPLMRREDHFWILTLLMASSLGGVQSLSRSVFGKLIPADRSSEFFGFYNVMGKFSAVFGPLFMGVVSQATGNPRLASLALAPFFAVGGLLLLRRKRKPA
jgi:UMF1 family MFS transporter